MGSPMPRKRRYCPSGLPVHVVQRGDNRQVCFASGVGPGRTNQTLRSTGFYSDPVYPLSKRVTL